MLADLHKKVEIRSDGLYWGVFDATFESLLRDFSKHAFDRADRMATARHDYRLMAFNELHQQLEKDGNGLVFVPMMRGIYELDFSVFISCRNVDFSAFTTDQLKRCSDLDVSLYLPSGSLVVAELACPFQIQSVATIPAGQYRACSLNDRDAEDRHAFLEDEYPQADGPDFKFILERQPD
jgi:hypothetical protein